MIDGNRTNQENGYGKKICENTQVTEGATKTEGTAQVAQATAKT